MSRLCEMVVKTTYEDLPKNVIDYAKKNILDTMAVTIGGSAMEGITSVVDLVKDKGGKPESIIPFYGGKVPASEAALAIGPMARAMDMGDGHDEAGHASEFTFPALLAATGLRNRVSGKEFITAFVVGQEMLVRIGAAFRFISQGVPRGRGAGHAIFGAVAAVGKLLGLNFDETEHAEGIARGMTQPHDMAMYEPPTLMIRVYHGFLCQDAINACLLAQRGITGPRGGHSDVLLGPKGYLAFASWETDPMALTEGIGSRWEMLNVMMKQYPACKCTHTSIDGLLDQMKRHRFSVEDIDHIDLDESWVNWRTVCTPEDLRRNPHTVAECQFSLPYVVATAAYDRDIFLSSYSPEARTRQDIREFMNRIGIKEDRTLPPLGARVSITLKNGKIYSDEYLVIKGDPSKPFTDEDLIKKFRKCSVYSAYELGSGAVDSLIETLLNLEKVDDVVSQLLYPVTPM